MPTYDPTHVEYAITTGFSHIVAEGGQQFPAYNAYPRLGGRLPCVVLIHDWWGLTSSIRRLANLFAQSGYHVIVPDLFDGQTATTAQTAISLLKRLGTEGYHRVHTALDVVEHHHHSNGSVAAVGIGMGGGLAFEAAITRTNLEAAVAVSAMPQTYLGRFKNAATPILAIYGSADTMVKSEVIEQLKTELGQAELAAKHRCELIDGLGHDFFKEDDDPRTRERVRQAISKTMAFLETHLQRPKRAVNL